MRQEGHEFKDSLGCIVSLGQPGMHKKKTKQQQVKITIKPNKETKESMLAAERKVQP